MKLMKWKKGTGFCFHGETELKAGVGNKAQGKMFLRANTGKPMRLIGYDVPVIIDMTGVTFETSKTPILGDHKVEQRIGHTLSQDVIVAGSSKVVAGVPVEGPAIVASGIRSSKTYFAKKTLEDIRGGFPFQVSVGASPKSGERYERGETVHVNGKTWKGPLIVSRRTVVREMSVCVLAADADTSVDLIAKQSQESEESMSFEDFLASLHLKLEDLSEESKTALQATWKKEHGEEQKTKKKPLKKKDVKASRKPDPEDEDEDDETDDPISSDKMIKAQRKMQALEMKRMDGIQAAAVKFGDRVQKVEIDGTKMTFAEFKAHAIEEGMSSTEFELVCFRNSTATPTAPPLHVKTGDIEAKALECSIMRAAQVLPMRAHNAVGRKDYGIETLFDEKTLEASDDKKYRLSNSIDELLSLQIRASGKYPVHRHGSELMAEAYRAYVEIQASGSSTLNIVNILENVMNKAAMTGFQAVEAVWPYLCGRRSLNDFKPHALYRLDFQGSFRKVATDGELKHISMTDTKKTIQASTYGAMIGIDRKTQRDDDLGLVVDKARTLGLLGGQRIEESVFVLLLSNPGSFFSNGNGNNMSGGATALSISSLSTARQKFRDQVIDGKPISLSPSILLVGNALEDTANRLWSQEKLGATGSTDALVFENNPHKGLYKPYIAPYLSNTNILDQDGTAISGQSSTLWYLMAPPSSAQGSAIVIGFLDGRETPFFDQAETTFNIPGGIQMRSYLDWGVAMHIPQLAVKSAGA